MPTVDAVIGEGALYFWDAGHRGYSYWMLMPEEGEVVAVELLPKALDPRIKPAKEVIEKGEYQRCLTPSEVDVWTAIVDGTDPAPYLAPAPA